MMGPVDCGFIQNSVFKRDFHRCKNGEWFQPTRVLLRCTRDCKKIFLAKINAKTCK